MRKQKNQGANSEKSINYMKYISLPARLSAPQMREYGNMGKKRPKNPPSRPAPDAPVQRLLAPAMKNHAERRKEARAMLRQEKDASLPPPSPEREGPSNHAERRKEARAMLQQEKEAPRPPSSPEREAPSVPFPWYANTLSPDAAQREREAQEVIYGIRIHPTWLARRRRKRAEDKALFFRNLSVRLK